MRANKSLGQHFLFDRSVVGRLVHAVSPQSSDVIIEIGPGTGAITGALAARAGCVYAIEADARLVAQLRADIESPNVTVIEGDALSIDWDAFIDAAIQSWRANADGGHLGDHQGAPRVRIVGNLPYYISTPILQVLMSRRARILDITVMLQKEVVDRIASPPGSRDYGYLSILIQFYCEVEKLFEVPPSAFKPAPEVRSGVVRLTLRREPVVAVGSEERYLAVVRAAFAQRRKTILNNLKAAARTLAPTRSLVGALEQAGIDSRRRAETLSLQDFGALCDSLYSGPEQPPGEPR